MDSKIQWPTAAVVAIAVTAIVLLALFGNDTVRAAVVPALGILATLVVSMMEKMRKTEPPTPPGPSILPILFAFGIAAAVASSACLTKAQAKAVTKDALTGEQIACAVLHAESDDAAIALACDVADAFLGDLSKVLEAHRLKSAALRAELAARNAELAANRARAGECGYRDGGAR